MPHGEEFSNTLLVKVAGRPIPPECAARLIHGYIDDSTNVPDMFVLRFSDDQAKILADAKFEIGAKIELGLQNTAPGGVDLLFKGEVTALEVEITETGMHTVVRGLDDSHRLFRGTKVVAFPKMTASDIVAKVAGKAGLKHKVDSTTTLLEYTSQDGVSDWHFLKRLAAESDRTLTMANGTLEFLSRTPARTAPGGSSSRTDPLVLERGVNLFTLRGTITANGQVPKVEVRGWDCHEKKAVVQTAVAETPSAAPAGAPTPGQIAAKFSSPPYVLGRSTINLDSAAKAAAHSLADHVAGGFAELDGVARGNPALRAGTPIRLANAGAPFSGKYVLTQTRHEFSPDLGYRTSFSASNTSERSLYGATHAAHQERPRVHGVVPALVTNTNDPEKLGRVKVKLPWLSDDYESGWARTLQMGGGKDRGTVVIPEINDEVLVAFEQGDLNHPYVLGGLFNKKDAPPAGSVDLSQGKVNRRSWISRKGMKIEFIDTDGSEQIVVSTNKGDNKVVLAQTDKKIEIVSVGDINVTAKGNVAVSTTAGDVSLKGKNVSIEATAGIDVKATGTLNLSAKASAKLEGTASTEVSSTGVMTVRGSVVKIN